MNIDATKLTRTAFEILVTDLEGHGNVLSDMHRAALYELVEAFAEYATGAQSGRRAFGLPTGTGKTSAVVAFLAALHRLGHQVPVAVAASRVEALCCMKRALLAHGIPAEWIGLKHADPQASEPSSGNDSRLFQLVTHARIRGGRDFELFGQHGGASRALLVYDETLMRSDSFAFSEASIRKALATLSIDTETQRAGDPLSMSLVQYLTQATGIITRALADLREQEDHQGIGAPVDLPELEESMVEAYRALVRRVSGGIGPWAQALDSLLAVSQDALQVLLAEQGGGVVAVREVVPEALRNVVILDASTPVRELVRLDPTIRADQSIPPELVKTYEQVQVHQLLAAGGRGSIEWSFKAKAREASAVGREVLDIVNDNPQARAFLVFSFLPRRGQVDVLGELKKELASQGVDLGAKTSEGKPRFEFLTWGNQEGLNGYEHCDVVIMAGVLHRSHLDIAAAIKGQVGHLAEPTPSDRLRQVIESEIAHVVYQGASRGSCRRTVNGKAQPMKLYLIHHNPSLKTILDRVMPGAVWSYPDPRHLKKAAGEGKAVQLLGQLLAYLKGLPEGTDKVSSKAAKQALGLAKDNATRLAFGRAVELMSLAKHGWEVSGRSFVRGATAYGFSVEG